MLRFLLISGLLLASISISAQGNVKGSIYADGSPAPYVQVKIIDSQKGVLTSDSGNFFLKQIPDGLQKLEISCLGYKKCIREIEIQSGKTLDLGKIELEEDVLGLETVVISGTMKPVYVSESPVKVEVISGKFLQETIAPTNLVEGLAMVNGVQEVVACGVCYTNSISINGLPGPYTAVLMDGTPIYGNLASVYGLNGIPSQIIDRIEIIKGPSSTIYGSEAVAGVINVITKDPDQQPVLALDVMGTSHLESFGNLMISPKAGKFSGYVGGNWAYMNGYDDENQDGFSDVVQMDRISLFSKWKMKRQSDKKFTIAGKYYYEDRRNGVWDYLYDRAYRNIRGNDSIYGESIYTWRTELFGTYEFPTRISLKLDYSFSTHYQDSYYGSDHYSADQKIAYGNLVWNKEAGHHDITGGLTNRYQYYDDNTIATEVEGDEGFVNQPDKQWIPGVFMQDEWKLNEKWTILSGMRLDYYEHHGLIPAPRLNLKYKPSEWTTLRANFGTGFRIVNLFTEDHAFITGQRRVTIEGDLRPERSWNGTLNFNHVYSLGEGSGTFDADLFYTWFNNKIVPDYSLPDQIIYSNAEGHAASRGISLSVRHAFKFPLGFIIGGTVQKVTETTIDENGVSETRDIEYAPQWSANGSVNYEWKKKGWLFAWTMSLTGPMALPEVYDLDATGNPVAEPRPTRSEPFAWLNLQVTKKFSKLNSEIYGGFQNLLNYRQPLSPLSGYNDPNAPTGFSPFFDTAYAYSPIHGREIYLGIRWSLNRKN